MSRYNRSSAEIRFEKHVKNLQTEVDQVKEVMIVAVEKATSRGENLDSLTARTNDLEQMGVSFRTDTIQMRRRQWWRNRKTTIILVCTLIVFLLVIILPFIPWK